MATLPIDSALTPGEYFTMGLFLTAEGILGVVCCGILLVSFMSNNNKTSPARSAIVVSLALSDMGIAVMCPFAASASFTESWPFGDAGCQTYAFFGMVFGTASVTNMAALSVDTFRQSTGQPAKSNGFLIMTIWVNALFWAVAPLDIIRWGRYTVEPFGTACLLDFGSRDLLYLVYIFLMVLVCFVIPVGAMIYSAVNVKTCMMMLVCLAFYWGVYAMVAVGATMGPSDEVPSRLYALAAVMSKLAPIGDTLLISWTNHQVQATTPEDKKIK